MMSYPHPLYKTYSRNTVMHNNGQDADSTSSSDSSDSSPQHDRNTKKKPGNELNNAWSLTSLKHHGSASKKHDHKKKLRDKDRERSRDGDRDRSNDGNRDGKKDKRDKHLHQRVHKKEQESSHAGNGHSPSSFDDVKWIPGLAFLGRSSLRIRSLSDLHPIFDIRGFTSHEECEHLIALGKPLLKPSTQIKKDSLVVDPGRSSWTAYITKSGQVSDDPVVHGIMMRAVAISGYPISHIESINIVRYRYGEEFGTHHDYFEESDARFLADGGQRLMTFFVYLNDVPSGAGGETHFPKLGDLKVRPKEGHATFWLNCALDDIKTRFSCTLHAGLPITTKGVEKYGMNIWIKSEPPAHEETDD